MSKKEYIEIARILRESTVMKGYDSLCYTMADWMASENPKFNKKHFLQACNSLLKYHRLLS